MNRIGWVVLMVLIAAGVSFATFKVMNARGSAAQEGSLHLPVHFASNSSAGANTPDSYPDLTQAAETAVEQVAHIKVQMSRIESGAGYYGASQQPAAVMASGSGVIISTDGYIVTNNHVVEDASDIQVVLTDKRTFSGKLIGRDPNTDLALIKISATGLSAVKMGNSDDVRIGQWVLAIGYPFSLNTTVTAGIVSAKERSIGIIGNKESGDGQDAASAVEAFIQTDAAINPGNSGGALINTAGELIGINAAIASQTGSYAGYGFAIPVNLVKKIVGDLKQFGAVKRGLLGVSFPSPATEDQVLKQRGINPGAIKGVYVTGVQSGSAAAAAGLREGDIIRSVDGNTVNSSVELSERIARHHPNDEIKLGYQRSGKELTAIATLKAQSAENTADNGVALNDIYNKLGAKFAPLDDRLKQRYQVTSGMVVTATLRGGFFEQVGIPPGSIIVSINGTQTNTPFELNKALMAASRGTVRIAAVMPDGSKVLFNLSLGA
ncbi:trypsin-like peptidase domain-containing protein [Mucilaginibacter lacusdianchii]|uniref:trypsin-like peptidase domain-containing protein n=1 Tax=Mucilaginibacter lacusdianchii TaxID=2684211 RepID=UPI001E408839|nr:trypsin-like peptidase domain-containing protein [Mucilaginibacter sp. JXJ CY 39]